MSEKLLLKSKIQELKSILDYRIHKAELEYDTIECDLLKEWRNSIIDIENICIERNRF